LTDCYCVAARTVAGSTLCALPLLHAEQRVKVADGKVVVVVLMKSLGTTEVAEDSTKA
jgi:hypothetical protein